MDDLSLPLLYGARLLFCADGRPKRWVFGPDYPPRLLIDHPPPLKLLVHDADGGLAPMGCLLDEAAGMTRLTGQPDGFSGRGWLELRSRGASLGRWPIEWHVDDTGSERLDAIRRLRAGHAFRDALDALDDIEGRASLDGLALLDSLELRARLHRDLGESALSSAAWEEGADLARALGLPTEAARRLRAAAFHALVQRRFVDAEALADRARAALTGVQYPPEALRTAYLDGLLADARCDYRGALRHLTRAHRLAGMLDDPHRAVIDGRLAIIEVHLGRMARARRLLAEGDEPANLHDRVARYLERAWFACHEHLAGEDGALVVARRWVERARATVPIEADRRLAARCALTGGWIALLDGRLADARSAHDECRALTPPAESNTATSDYGEPSRALLEGRLLLAEGAAAHARGVFEALVHQVRDLRADLPSPLVWSALHGVGQAWLAEGDADAALSTWRRALAELDRAALDVGRAQLPAFVAAVTLWDASTRLMDDVVDLLAERDPRAAFAVVDAHFARRQRTLDARSRVARLDGEARAHWTWRLQALERRLAEYGETRADWSIDPAARRTLQRRRKARVQAAFDDAMALLDRGSDGPAQSAVDVLAVDDALLACRTRADGGLEVWWIHRGAVHRFVDRALADVLSERLDGVGHLYVITGGHDAAWHLPGVELNGVPLATQVSLSFVPQVRHLGQRAAPRDGRPVALVDPERDLPHARKDGAWLAEHIDAEVRLGPAVTRAAWLDALDAPALHFSGHGERDPDAPWQGVLRLADAQAIQPEDLTGRSAPCRVVLVGCGTGTAFGAEAISLPTAFLLAGACSVVATVAPIDDAEASRFVRRFYSAGGLRAPGAALRVAVEASWKAGEAVWRAFRLVGSP